MMKKVNARLDAIALALGGVSLAGAFGTLPLGAVPIVANDRINAAWDAKLQEETPRECSKLDPDCANAGWAT
ncbi:MAG: hypothetical protein EX272_06455 [Chromatiales bacterium]|nr:MAG: hypothetical protein EX272_06455 [Chromatiales bacterium]